MLYSQDDENRCRVSRPDHKEGNPLFANGAETI